MWTQVGDSQVALLVGHEAEDRAGLVHDWEVGGAYLVVHLLLLLHLHLLDVVQALLHQLFSLGLG